MNGIGHSLPPKKISSYRIVSYAFTDEIAFIQRNTMFVDGVALGRVPCLAIGIEDKSSAPALLYCDTHWGLFGVAVGHSIASRKEKAALSYPGVESDWRDVGSG